MATIFTCFALKRSRAEIDACPSYADYNLEQILTSLLPNDTRVWNAWRKIVLDVLLSRKDPSYFVDAVDDDPKLADLRNDQRTLLRTLLLDAKAGYLKYQEYAKGDVDKQCIISSARSVSDEKI
ncbi:hypothetical protein CPB84DRAFT_1850752 [Gymnopilus junonius]|uniref:Uncharacterized protein n=1 Tax=Gymnopilus junonius TaxID=109634 RepID=A0A9P5NFW7_GYMJU|nr:hypothetical protein CPB84DRAFT_1850752 [Gymnopilus junonius]